MANREKPKSDYFAERIRAELAFARSHGANTPEALARHLNKRGFMTREGRPWTEEDAAKLLA